MKHLPFIFLLSGVVLSAEAQQPESSASKAAASDTGEFLYTPPTRSPDLDRVIRYDRTDVSLSYGQIAPVLPLVELDDPDFEFPIEACYSARGFVPTETDGMLGMHWTLRAGGVIYREIKGVPDESPGTPDRPRGFLAVREKGYDDRAMKERLLNSIENEVHTGLDMDYVRLSENTPDVFYAFLRGTDIEPSSDIYHFRFGRHSGHFMINFDGSVNVVSDNGGHYRVDLSGFTPASMGAQGRLTIAITTDDGFIYRFGGSYGAMEYNAYSWSKGVGHSLQIDYSQYVNAITAFYLTRIVAPNGRVLTVSYDESVDAKYHERPYDILLDTRPVGSTSKYPYNYQLTARYGLPHFVNYEYQPLHECYALKKTALVRSVETDRKRVDFEYSLKPAGRYKTGYKIADECGARLDAIEVSVQSGSGRERCRLEYTRSSGEFPRDFLTALHTPRDGTFRFGYVGLGKRAFSGPLTTNVDFWEFWRGVPESRSLVPKAYALSSYIPTSEWNFRYEGEDRHPTGNEYDLTLLDRIEYPTGGHAEFEYERNTYYTTFEQDHDYMYLRIPREGTLFMLRTGGARIRGICYFDGKNAAPVKKFKYQYTSQPNKPYSSGILAYKPLMVLRDFYDDLVTGNIWDLENYANFTRYSPNGFKTEAEPNPHIQYSVVREYLVEEDRSTPVRDSVVVYSLDGTSSLMKKELSILVTSRPGEAYERMIWEIEGTDDAATNETANLAIYNSMGNRILNYNFYRDSHDKPLLKYDPVTYLPDGTYRIVMTRTPNTRVSLKITYKLWETDEIEGPYRELKFSTLKTNPDIHTKSRFFYTHPPTSHLANWFQDTGLVEYFQMPYDHRAYERGKLLEEAYYTADGKPVRRTSYRYDRIGVKTNVGVQVPSSLYFQLGLAYYSHVWEQTWSSYLPVEIRTEEFDRSGRVLTRCERRKYTAEGYLSETESSDSDGGRYVTTYRRIMDDPAYGEWHDLNIVSPVTEVRKYRKTGSSSELLEGSDTEYGIYPGMNGARFSAAVSRTQYGADGRRRTTVEYLAYDRRGNPVCYRNVQDGNIPHVLWWGRDGGRVEVQIDNATPDEVLEALNLNSLEELDHEAVGSLRRKLPNAFVSTFSYDPLYGTLRSRTDASGEETRFSYDDRGRWIETRTDNEFGEQIIRQKNHYHYLNE